MHDPLAKVPIPVIEAPTTGCVTTHGDGVDFIQRGENFGDSVFLAIDCLGGVFSLLSLVFKESFDGIAAANYIGIVVLELAIFALYLILNPRARRQRQEHEVDSGSTAPVTAAQDIEQTPADAAVVIETPEWSRHTAWDEKPPTLPTNQQHSQNLLPPA
ncbi:uncharacterized protein UBRO_07431 [Ustilago bromivora]|uniref:Uncharacterized protein n=1 Tax=Ustilago bromivora TaxID=307758 RepID=A0A1K0GWM2_9BASI|nr:uncharacterized protein UBRO_07431 [Ustilago bromivora]